MILISKGDGSKMSTVTLPKQTLGEEIANSISHGLGILLAAAGTAVMIYLAVGAGGLSGAVIYGISLTVLYTASCVYHAVPKGNAKRVLRVFDHCSIFLLIAGTYAPITLVALKDTVGLPLFTVIAACAVIGIVCNLIDLERFGKLSMALYVVMGWMAIIAVKPLLAISTPGQFALLVGGGLCYTAGIAFYAHPEKKYMHFVWHLFVLAGSILHYFYVIQVCYL